MIDLEKEREDFEKWYENVIGRSLVYKTYDRSYLNSKTQEAWEAWQAAKAQAVPEAISIGNELQSWVAVNSFSADDGEGVLPVVDANAIAEKIEELTGANQ